MPLEGALDAAEAKWQINEQQILHAISSAFDTSVQLSSQLSRKKERRGGEGALQIFLICPK